MIFPQELSQILVNDDYFDYVLIILSMTADSVFKIRF